MIRWKNQSSSTNEKKKLHERKSLFSIAFLTSTFTVCQYSIQNVLGRCFKFHSGHFGPALFFIALVSNSGSLFLSNSLNSFAHDILEQNLSKEIISSAFFKDLIPSPHGYTYKPEGTMEVPISRIYAGLATNFLLEKGNFRTIVPSTIVGLGSYAVGKYLNSLPTDKAAATQNQRIAIQRIGRRCGCHHCGSRLSRTFIADHMPPTKFVEEWKRKWYNKLFKRKVTLLARNLDESILNISYSKVDTATIVAAV